MDSPQSIVSPLKSSSLSPESEKKQNEKVLLNRDFQSPEINSQENKISTQDNSSEEEEDPIGALEVYIHQARDIHNICIYQKQDVYAKLSLTCNPEKTVSTKIINGGGRNPIFNESLRLNIGKVDASLKCEIWMLSRVRNYLEDQLLGFALVPVSEVLLHNGKIEREFSLSSTDLFHSPAGFVKLSVTFLGTPPEVIPIIATADPLVSKTESIKSLPGDLDKIEFPDPRVANENQSMVEEYFSMPCPTVGSSSSESFVSSGDPENNKHAVADSSLKVDSPLSSVSTNETSSASNLVSFHSSESTSKDSKSSDDKHVSQPKDSSNENGNGEAAAFVKQLPVVTVNVEQEPKVVQQDIVDMYMKSMQQFTESLAKMKLPMDLDSGPTSLENSSSDQKTDGSTKNSGSRVFYGSRAFF